MVVTMIIKCERCNAALKVPASLAEGQPVRCPYCQYRFIYVSHEINWKADEVNKVLKRIGATREEFDAVVKRIRLENLARSSLGGVCDGWLGSGWFWKRFIPILIGIFIASIVTNFGGCRIGVSTGDYRISSY